ncbi:hypothetical protein B0T17DRAFT_618994 [Bombardia bombarda]|uniref:Uncharacterized protein n=1 Tax=Bombardia bombarda TaxID=252184 RepID=A0AA39WMZ7_9PEZI|nr:hypothetical protein B0T17DRAFT_618994 [Bombardia bombarda]
MAPRASEPRQVLFVLHFTRRLELYTLIMEITTWMRSQIELNDTAGDDTAAAPLFVTSPDPTADDDDTQDIRTSDSSSPSQRRGPSAAAAPSAELIRLRQAALAHFDAWQKDVVDKLREILSVRSDAKQVDELRKRRARQAKQRAETPAAGEDLIDFGDGADGNETATAERERAQAVARLQALYHAIPSRLVTIPLEDREEVLSCVLLVLLSAGTYSAHSRALAVYLASALGLPLATVNAEEVEIAKSLVETSADAARQQENTNRAGSMSADAEKQKQKQENQASRYWKVGLASVAGAALIGVTGGLAAPVVAGAIGGLMGSVGLGGVASFLGIFWMNGALVGTLFGAFGARMTGEMVDQYAREVEDFRFIPLKEEWGAKYKKAHNDEKDVRRLRVTIGVNGWLTTQNDITGPWRCLGHDSETFALRYELKSLLGLGQSLQGLVSSYTWNYVKAEILKRTVLATLWSALWPVHLLSAATSIDNPFSLARNRSEKAGEILADALINKVQGERPVTLIGYSLGARVIYACLRTLAKRRAFGLVDTVVFIGSPVPSNRHHWQMMRSVVSGKMFNVYSENDYLLAFLYRATSIQLGIAGLQEIKDIEGVENLDLSEEVQGHMRYPDLIDKILARCEVPVVAGTGAGPIEKEDVIVLTDLDGSRTGTLIDFGFDNLSVAEPSQSSSKPAPPPRETFSMGGMSNKNAVKAQGNAPIITSSQDLAGHHAMDDEDDNGDDDEESFGIKLVDNDDEGFEFVEPIPIND